MDGEYKMIVENQKVKVKWHPSNRKHYESFGFIFTKVGDEFEVSPECLPEKSQVEICIICDFCNTKSMKKRCGLNLDGHHFCSNSCAGKHLFTNNNPNPKKDKIMVNCNQCNIEFEVFESVATKNKWHFCSRECYANFRHENLNGEKVYNYQDIKTNCIICGEEFKTTEWELEQDDKGKFCSPECYYKYRSMYYVGENHPMYGTAKTPEQIEHMRIVTSNRIANGEFPQTNTSIQIMIREILKQLKIEFDEEIPFKYYVLDFYNESKNLAIEVMGDYWHANPQKYNNYDNLHDIQKKDVRRDKSKNTYLKKYHNIDILYLWEHDINENKKLCKELIEKYVYNNGILENYNSFNYSIVDDKLILNEDKIKPYFM